MTTEMRPGLRTIARGTYDDINWYKIEAHIWTRLPNQIYIVQLIW